jgi:hypothetical protein
MLGELTDGESVKTVTRRETNQIASSVARKLGYSVGSGKGQYCRVPAKTSPYPLSECWRRKKTALLDHARMASYIGILDLSIA